MTQLILEIEDQLEEGRDQLGEAEECISWYERMREKVQARISRLQQRLNDLRELADLVRSSDEDDDAQQ